jgi:hypothetical protein
MYNNKNNTHPVDTSNFQLQSRQNKVKNKDGKKRETIAQPVHPQIALLGPRFHDALNSSDLFHASHHMQVGKAFLRFANQTTMKKQCKKQHFSSPVSLACPGLKKARDSAPRKCPGRVFN